jgi:hypothetical protein
MPYHQPSTPSLPAPGIAAVNEWVAMSLLAGLLVLVGGYYLLTAIRTLRRTTPAYEMLPDERRFLRRQAWRRLVNSLLMLILAGLLVGAYLAGLPQRAAEIDRDREMAAQAANGVTPKLTDEQRQFIRFFMSGVIVFLMLLFVIVMMAGLDLLATRRYALYKFRQIQTDRRAMIQRQLDKWREERDQD